MKLFFRHLLYSTALLLLCVHCTNNEFTYSKFIVGARCEVKFYLYSDSLAQNIIYEIDNEFMRIDSLLNRFSDISLVSDLNRNLKVAAPEDIIQLVLLSDSISHITGGLFDISVAPLLETWGFYEHEFMDPDTVDIKTAVQLVDYKKIRIKKDSIIIMSNMKLDFGGIAQGYAADRVADILKKHNIKSALINVGGEIVLIGRSPEKRPWRIGIKNPRGEGIIETVETENLALSTSGDYEKFFLIKNKRYPHIINPKTGYPALGFASVTVFAESAAYADAIATAVAIMGPETGLKFLDSLGIKGIIYHEENGRLQRVESQKKEDIE
ncbi:MAG: FAD:protein FMN transferase [bacterium]